MHACNVISVELSIESVMTKGVILNLITMIISYMDCNLNSLLEYIPCEHYLIREILRYPDKFTNCMSFVLL